MATRDVGPKRRGMLGLRMKDARKIVNAADWPRQLAPASACCVRTNLNI